MKLLTFLTFIICSSCLLDTSNIKITTPPGSTICYKDPDCLEGQYCGFVWGYNGAVCIGQATSNDYNPPPIPPINH